VTDLDLNAVAAVVRCALEQFPLRATYRNEQRDLQPQVQAAIETALREGFPGRPLQVIVGVGGTGKPSLKLRGTSFWPDVEVRDGQTPLIAVEIKLVRKRASTLLAEALGQAVIYSCHYPKVFALVVHLGAYNAKCKEYDTALDRCLAGWHIEMVVRRPAT
jgi:hypothetical protein